MTAPPPLSPPIGSGSGSGTGARPGRATPQRGFAARLFGYDLFISFALGPPPRGTQSYASDLARRLRERDFTVFFSEDEAAPGGTLSDSLRDALYRSKALVVVSNRSTLEAPRWVRTEVEEYRRRHPGRPIIPINVDGALQDPALDPDVHAWLDFRHRIWLDESAHSVSDGIASAALVDRLALAPNRARASVRWRWLVRGVMVSLLLLSIGLAVTTRNAMRSAEQARAELRRAVSLLLIADAQSMLAGTRAEGDERAMLQVVAAHRLAPSGAADAALLGALIDRLALRKLIRAAAPIAALQLSADGRQLVSAEFDHHPVGGLIGIGIGNSLQRWDLLSGQPLGAPVSIARRFGAVDFSADGQRLASTCEDDSVCVWDSANGSLQLGPLRGENWLAQVVAFSPDGHGIIAGYQNGSLQRWDARSGAPLGAAIAGHAQSVSSIAFSRDGSRFVSGGSAPPLRLWDSASAKPLAVSFGSAGSATEAIAWSPDGQRLLAGGRLDGPGTASQDSPDVPDGPMLRLLQTATGQASGVQFSGSAESVTTLAYGPDGQRLASAGFDGAVRLWTLGDAAGLAAGPGARLVSQVLTGHRGSVNSLLFSPDASLLVSGGDDGDIRVWHTDPKPSLGLALQGSDSGLSCVAFSPDGSRVVTGNAGGAGSLRLWDAATGRVLIAAFDGHTNRVSGVAFMPDGRRIVSASTDGTLRLWDAATGQQIGAALAGGQDGPLHRLAVSADGSRIAASGHSFIARRQGRDFVRLWDGATGQPVPTRWNGADAGFTAFAFTADGRRLLVGERNGGLRLIDLASGEAAGPAFIGHSLGVTSALFSPDGSHVASADGNGLRLWDAHTGRPIGQPRAEHASAVTRLAYSADGSRLVSASRDGTLRLWDGRSGQPIGPAIAGHQQDAHDVAYSRDGLRIASAGADGSLRLWPAPQAWPALLCDKLQRNMSRHEWRDWVSPEIDYRVQCPGLPIPVDVPAVAAVPASAQAAGPNHSRPSAAGLGR